MRAITTPSPKSSAEIMEFVRELLLTCTLENVTSISVAITKEDDKGDIFHEAISEYVEDCDPDDVLDAIEFLKFHAYDALGTVKDWDFRGDNDDFDLT